MSETAFQKQYRQEFIAGFETRESLLRSTVTTEVMMKGNEAEFLVVSTNGASAVTRGVNGDIPTRGLDSTRYTATLVEWHDVPEITGFNVFASQGNQRDRLQRESMQVINRKIDADILTELNTATVNTGTATTASVPMVLRAKSILQNAKVPWDNNLFAVVSPVFDAYLMQTDAYANADLVDTKVWADGGNAWQDRPKAKHWAGVNWIVHADVPGVGTSAEKCFMFHKSAIGHAVNSGNMSTVVGYDDKNDKSWARCTVFMGSKKLQNSGIVVMNHDASAMAAA